MTIRHIAIYKLSIPMVPFTIATGTMDFAQNIFIRIFTGENIYGVGECSAFPMIVGETQATCFAMAQDFAKIWKGKNPLDIPERMAELHAFTAGNSTIKSAFDMALYDLAAKHAGLPLYQFLGAKNTKRLETDLTIGIAAPADMAAQAADFEARGVRIIKVKLGKSANEDIERIKQIRQSVSPHIQLRIDANQGWSFEDAKKVLTALAPYDIEFCEQPMRTFNDHLLPALKQISPIPIMADESVYHHLDAARMIRTNSCSSVNIKFSKTGGLLEAIAVNAVCAAAHIPCMMGGMLESRLALSAFAHFATAFDNVSYYDMDTCLLGHTEDPVTGGVQYNGFFVELPTGHGIGADINDQYLLSLEQTMI
jgi:L-Ala-D/L-Glu epimerase